MDSTDIQEMKFAVAASFTAEPLMDSLRFWSQKLHWQARIEFAGYNQVFQQLLDPESLLSTNHKGINILLVRPEDWLRYEPGDNTRGDPEGRAKIQQNAHQLVDAVRRATQHSATPYLVCVCPPSPDKAHDSRFCAAEESICSGLQSTPGVDVLRSMELSTPYPVGNYCDPDRDEMGHIPYTAEYFAALGTIICRKIHARRQTPYKVIVLDCDETLWKGVCGEVGPLGIEIDAGRKSLQEFVIGQRAAGMLLCLCSKNNQEDVDDVFRRRLDMPLRPEHITAARINWQPKPANLRELASELQLGLDSFIFIDDNPLECEQVKASCPEALTLSLPHSSEAIPQFLANVWAFDKQRITEEDRKRGSYYHQNRERDRFLQQAPSLESFLAGLELRIDISSLSTEQLPRVAQLMQRTNQFNCTSLRRSEDQIRQLWQAGELECLTITVGDRFGDYGLVGAMAWRVIGQALEVDTFLLSCRVLGRGVEHRMLRKLGEIAQARCLARVDVQYVPSKKNSPAFSFLESVAAPYQEDAGESYCFRIPAACAAGISEDRILATSQLAPTAARDPQPTAAPTLGTAASSELMQEIATQLADAQSITLAIRGRKSPSAQDVVKQISGQTPEEQAVAEVWSDVLGISELGPGDDFFLLGGDSLLGTQVISRLRQVCGVRLHLRDIFENSTVARLADSIRRLRQDAPQQVLEGSSRTGFEPGAAKAGHRAYAGDVIPRRADHAPCALSFAQQRWWFLNQWAPGSSDHLSLVLRLKGELDLKALERALSGLTERHQVLRTRYVLIDGSPVQVISPLSSNHLTVIDLERLAEADREPEAEKILQQQFRQPFDLSSDPILRPTLVKLSRQDHVLVLVMHHIASDAWTRGIVLRELEALYTAFAAGQEPALAEMPIHYSDYALWQRERMANGDLDEQLSFYKQGLAGAPSVLELPTDRPRPGVQDLREGVHVRVLSKELLDGLQNLSHQSGTTLFMTLLAAYQVLLFRYSGQEDLVIGSPAAGRNHPSVEGLIGCFINMVVFRNQVRGDETFRHLLARVREIALAAQDNQDLPFERLVEELQHGRNMSCAPIFQIVFALENPLPTPRLPRLQVDLREEETRTAFHDLSLFVAARQDGLRVRFEYRTDLFNPDTIERMAGHFENLLSSILEDPTQNVSALHMLSEVERTRLLHAWNQAREFPAELCIHQRFEQQAQRAPQNVALVFEDQSMSYGELNARSNQLARYLIRMGVGPDVLVGLCVERSLDMVVAIVGILKAGGAYLPLDPRYPKDRLAFMVEDAKPPVVLTHYELKESLPDMASQVVALDADWVEMEREDVADLVCPAGPDNLAYVIYTSGSTGRPKGCQVTHANVVRLFDGTQHWYGFDEHDVWTMFHSYAFDFSVWELWGALIYGGRVVVIPYLVSRSPEEFYRLLVAEKITVLNQTPSSFRQLMYAEEILGTSRELSLRYVIFGGEALELQSLKPWFERHGDQNPRLVNMYGITETTVHVTYRPLSVEDTAAGSVIGCPLPDLQVYVLDRHLQPTPVGVPGEIYVGGAGVARGYLNRPELNAERFIADVFRPGVGHRLYKSGDLARRLPNGDLEYLGRIDQQVKIRGFRIELGEIENVLAKHPAVRESVVILNNATGEKRLLAYVVPQTGQAISPSELHAFLKGRLPEYMVQAAIVQLESMPLTSNGKIDRRMLPEPDLARPERGNDYVAPHTPLEEEVAAVWREVLGRARVGVKDNFFEIGGHSLLATRVIMLLHSKLGLSVSLRLLFENPTIAGMACALMEALLEHAEEPALLEMVSEVEALSDEDARQMHGTRPARRPSGVEQ